MKTQETMSNPKKFGFPDKIGYMLGDVADSFFFMLVSTYLIVFYTDVYGISAAFGGTLLLVAKFWEAFTDVAWGRFIDTRKVKKNGKFRPWILRMSLPLVLTGVLLFVPFTNMADNFYYAYSFVSYMLWTALFSTISIPYGAMASVISDKPDERTSLSSYRSLGLTIANLIVTVIAPLLLFVDDQASGSRFFITAILFGIIAMVAYLGCYNLTTERIEAPPHQEKNYLKTVKSILTSRVIITVFLVTAVFLSTFMFFNTINVYVFKNYFSSTKALSLVGFIQGITVIIMLPLVVKLAKKYGKKETVSFSLLISSLAFFFLFFFENIMNLTIYLIFITIALFGIAIFTLLMWAFVTDAIDYHEYTTGLKEDGTVYSLYSISRRIGQGVAGGVSGYVLAWIGYDGSTAEQAQNVLHNIYTLSTLVPAIGLLIMVILLVFIYPLNKNRTEKLAEDLNNKRNNEI